MMGVIIYPDCHTMDIADRGLLKRLEGIVSQWVAPLPEPLQHFFRPPSCPHVPLVSLSNYHFIFRTPFK